MSQTIGTQTTNFLWDTQSPYGDVIRESDGSGAVIASYVLADGQLISQDRSGATSYYLTDGQGNVRALANDTGSVTDTYTYSAFGELLDQQHETPWPKGLPSAGESVNAPHRLILGREHNLDNDALVSVEKTTVYVYYRDRVSGAFGEWAKLSGEKNYAAISKWAKSFSEEDQNKIISSLIPEVKYSVFYDAIISAMTGKKEKERFEG